MSSRKLFVIFLFIFVNTAELVQDYTSYDYHKRFGIPTAVAVKNGEEISNRIVGGAPTELGVIPFHAGLVITLQSGAQSICGGSLISNIKVLTAAHCWWDGANRGRTMTVVLGSKTIFSGGTRLVAKDVAIHQSWNPENILYDIAMVTIDRVTLNNNINVVSLPSAADAQNTFAGTSGIASGFGKTSDGQTSFPPTTYLRHVTLPIITNVECQKSFEMRLESSHLCTSGVGGKGTCDGDSGGPLAVTHRNLRTLVGLSSFGLGSGCERGYPSVYTRITSYLSWIQTRL